MALTMDTYLCKINNCKISLLERTSTTPVSYPELGNTFHRLSHVLMSCITFRFSYLLPHDSSRFHHVVLLHASVYISSYFLSACFSFLVSWLTVNSFLYTSYLEISPARIPARFLFAIFSALAARQGRWGGRIAGTEREGSGAVISWCFFLFFSCI